MKKQNIVMNIFVFLTFCVSVFTVSAESLDIKGIVLDSKTGSVLPYANVTIEGTNRGAAANSKGEFIIKNVTAGEYTLHAKVIGYETGEQKTTVSAQFNPQIRFELNESYFQMDQVVITATRSEKLLQDVPVITEFISQTEIEEKGADDLAEAMEDRPGILVESNSSGGKILRMNGIDNKRILILMDGNPIAGKIHDRVELNMIDSDKIDHIEIVKGPGSALYGSEAMGGVVNIITKGFTDNFDANVNLKTGSHDLYSGNLNLSGKKNGIGYRIDYDHMSQGEYKNSTEISFKDQKIDAINGKISFPEIALGNFEASVEYKEHTQKADIAGYTSINETETDVDHWNTNLNWNKKYGSLLNMNATGYISDNFRTYKTAPQSMPQAASTDTTEENIIGLKTDFLVSAMKGLSFNVGYDYSNNDYKSDRVTDKITREQHGVFTQAEVLIKKLTLNIGGRYDKITDFDGRFSPRVSAMFEVTPELKLRSSWGAGFRAPSFLEMYSNFSVPGMPFTVIGNGDLTEEKSNGTNVGVEYSNDKFLVSGSVFQNKFTDLIADYTYGHPPFMYYSYQNIDEATFNGFELQTKIYIIKNLSGSLSYNYTKVKYIEDSETMTNTDETNGGMDVPPHTISVRLNYRLLQNRLNLSVRNQYYGKVTINSQFALNLGTDADAPVKKEAYNLLDASAAFKVNRFFKVRAGVNNIRDYTNDVFGPWFGRQYFVGVETSY